MALIALGVTGGIGAYKAVEIARGLQKHGHDVGRRHDARRRRRFVGAADLRGDHAARGDHRPVDAGRQRRHRAHRDRLDASTCCWSRRPPPTRIGKFANGIADDFLSSLYLATTRAGAAGAGDEHATCSSTRRWRENLATLPARGVRIVEPGEGYLACGWIGKGRLAEPDGRGRGRRAGAAPSAAHARRPPRAGHGRADLRGHRSGALHRQPVERPHGLSRWRPRRCAAAPR